MTVSDPQIPLPIRPLVAKSRWGWNLTFLLCLVVFGIGIYAYVQQRLHGDIVTGMRSVNLGGAVWGTYIIGDITFVGFAFACLSISAIAHIFRSKDVRPYSRIGDVLAWISLCMAGLCVMADLGRPLAGLMNLPRYARTMSPFFGTFTMVVGFGTTASVILVYLCGRGDAYLCKQHVPRWRLLYRIWGAGFIDTRVERARHRLVSRAFSLVVLPFMVLAYSTLGFVFGIQSGRPGWFSALQAPSFLVLGAISGTGLLIFVAGAVAKGYRIERAFSRRAYHWLDNAMLVMLLIYLYFIGVEELTARYAASEAQTRLAVEVTTGAYAPHFWGSLAILIFCTGALTWQLTRKAHSVALSMTIGVLVNVAAVLRRFLVVVPSQTHGALLPYPQGAYAPTWIEYAVISGIVAFGVMVFLLFVRIFPIVPVHETGQTRFREVPVTRPRRRLARILASSFVLLVGLVLATLGLLWSARYDTTVWPDPAVNYSSILFIAGIVLCLGSAAVFELFPRALPPRELEEGPGARTRGAG